MRKLIQTQYYWGAAVGIILVLILTGWFIKSKAEPKKVTEDIPLVETQTVGLNDSLVQSNRYSGEVRGRYEGQLAFLVNGKIIRRNIDLGSIVKEGEVLIQIDPIDMQQGTNANKAQLFAAESQYKMAKDNLERFREVYNKKLMSKAEFDRYQTMYDAADAQLRQAKAQYTASANQLNYCNLYADQSGVVARINAETGQVVQAGQPVVVVVSGNEREVEINVPENRIEDLNKQQKCQVTFWALSSVSVEGKVREISPMADAITRTYKVRISLVNPPSTIKLGMTATVRITDPNGLLDTYIPLSAIYQTDQTPAVWVVNQGVVRLKPVKLGTYGDGDQVQVLEGIHSGDRIVTAGVHKLREEEKVRIGDDNL